MENVEDFFGALIYAQLTLVLTLIELLILVIRLFSVVLNHALCSNFLDIFETSRDSNPAPLVHIQNVTLSDRRVTQKGRKINCYTRLDTYIVIVSGHRPKT